jgi:hypothetical protein
MAATGELFHAAGYGLAFGRDSTAFVPWSRVISELKEAHVIAKMMDANNERDFGIGQSGAQKFRTRCGESSVFGKFILSDFIGLYIVLASFLLAGFIAHFTEAQFFKKPIDPFDQDLGQSKKLLTDPEARDGTGTRTIEDIEQKLEEMREKQEKTKEKIQRILHVVRQWHADGLPFTGGPGMRGRAPLMITAGQDEAYEDEVYEMMMTRPRELLRIEPVGVGELHGRMAVRDGEHFAFA